MMADHKVVLSTVLFAMMVLSVSGSGVMFSGFTERGTYYTNGDTVTLLNCSATVNGQVITNLTWYYETSGGEVDTGSRVIRFEDVVSEAVWRDTRQYYCRATYEDNNAAVSTDSGSITVIVKYNTTITVSYDDTIHIRSQTVRGSIRIPVMTENVELRCGVESAEWSYDSLQNQPNPLTLDLFTVQFNTGFSCRDSIRVVLSVNLVAVGEFDYDGSSILSLQYLTCRSTVGSGVWQQEGGSYTELTEGEAVTLTEDVSLVCVTSSVGPAINWYFRGESLTGGGERLTDNLEYDGNRGFLTLNISRSLPTNRTGYYYCFTNENEDVSSQNTRFVSHNIRIVLPTETTTITTTTTTVSISTPTLTTRTTSPSSVSTTTHVMTSSAGTSVSPSPHSVTLSFSYTPEHEVVFVGADDVTLLCVASSVTSSDLSVSIRDERRELSSKTGSGAVSVQYRVNHFTAGFLLYRCVASSSSSSVEENVTVVARDVYEQEVTGLTTSDISEDSLKLEWNVTYEAIAEEEFIISINNLNGSTGWVEVGRTSDTFYTLNQLIPGGHYILRVRVTNRLNATSSLSINYIHTASSIELLGLPTNTSILSTVIGIILLIIMLVLCRIILSVFCICIGIRRKPKTKNNNKAYKQLSVTNTNKKPSRHKTDTSKNRDYTPLQVMPLTTPSSVECATELSEEVPPNHTAVTPHHKAYYELDFDANTGMPFAHGDTSDDTYCQIEYEIFAGDKLSPNQPPVPLDSLKQFIDTLWSNGMLELRREFDELQLNLMRAPVQVAKLRCNEKLNRDSVTLPYDRSRVRLAPGHSSDYVNASIIPGPFSQQTFIAAQLPMHATSGRFWSMVWEQKVSTVLMVSSRDEAQHMYRYWPVVGGTQAEGELRVRTVKEEEVGEVLVSHKVSLSLCSSPKQVSEVLLLEFRGWPENEHCMMSHDVVSCVRSVRNTRGVKGLRGAKTVPSGKKVVSPFPICVCCVTGCGRTGAIIALYNLLESVESGSSVSVFNCVNGMRNHRPYMVQTLNQYRMLYMALLEIVAGNTRVDLKDTFRSEYMVEREFSELEYQCERGFERSSCVGVGGKMDSNTPLPYGDTRVLLDPPLHTFYNASYIRSAVNDSVNDFIAAVSPRHEEVDQLMQIVFQHKCPLVVALGNHNNNNKLAKYWDIVGGVKSGSLRVNKLSSIEMEDLFICELKLEHVSGDSHTFQHIYSSTWSGEGVPSSYRPVLKLLEILLQNEGRANPVMVHCVDGAGASGVVLAACLGVRWRRECEVDLFQACKYLRFHRRRMVSTSEQYRICYEIVRQYLGVLLANNYENLASIS